jgi:xanthine dehydrogenase YagT iron-sulfur-binding subunit
MPADDRVPPRVMSPEDPNEPSAQDITRRSALKRGLLLGGALLVNSGRAQSSSVTAPQATPASDVVALAFQLNGKLVECRIEARTTLLDLLRDDLGHPGTKKGCDHGQCGACTVHIDGRRVLSCLTLAATLQGRAVTTIEGLGTAEHLHPLQSAFIEHDAFQCGFCTPGQIMAAAAFLREPGSKTADGIREGMSGNICRCGAYCGIVAAVGDVCGRSGVIPS